MQGFADRLIGRHPTGANQRGRRADALAEHPESRAQPVYDHVAHRLLERGAEIGDILIAQWRDFLGFEAQCGLEAGKREICVMAPGHRPRQRKPLGIAARRLLLHQRSAGKAEAEQLCGLVEGFADGVIDRPAEPQVIADAEHAEDLRVAAGREKQAIGKRRGVGQPRSERVRLQMVDRDQRLAMR